MTTAAHLDPADSRRRNLAIVAVAALTALALVFFMISSVTSAAWTDTTRNDDNSWATGTVSLTDDDLGAAMFTVTDMVPGDEVDNSITVTNGSSVPLDVRLYGENLTATVFELENLAEYLNVTIGTTEGGDEVYTGTLAGFAATHAAFGSGTAVINMAAAGTQTYYVWVQLDPATPDSFQGASAGIDFVWEGQTQ